MNGLKITAFFGLFLSANTAIAIQGGAIVPVAASLSGVIQVNGDDTNCLDIHPYSLNDAAMPYAKVSMSLQDSVSAMTKKVGVSLGQSVQKKQTYRFRNLEHAEGKFCDMHNDIVMVNGYVRSSFRPSDASMEQGYIGLAPGSAQGLSNPEAIDKVLEVVSDAEIQYDKLGPSCLMVEGDELVLTKEVHFTDPRLGLPMIARVQPDKVTISQNHFSAAGQVEAYVLNPDDGALTTYNYSTFNDGTSNMSSPNFITAVEGSSRASETDLDFSGYASSSANFEEANAYAHVNEAFATYAASGFGFYGPAPMSVGVRDTFGTGVTQDNAVFIPGSSTSTGRPQIRLGEGTGTSTGSPRLQNLGLDLDVVAHELGHYVLFETLKDASAGSESLVIHEGGADFLAFAHSGDACLGESTCPSGSVICAQTSCLRSGLNSNKITDGQFDPQTEFHLLGQLRLPLCFWMRCSFLCLIVGIETSFWLC